MAIMSPKSISFLLLLITLFFSMQIHAREGQFFFSKVSSSTPTTIPTTAIPTANNEKEKATTTTIAATKQPGKEPTFIPETNNGNYGLYSQQYQEDTTNTQKTLGESGTNKNNNYYRPIANNNGYEDQQQEQEQQEEDRFVQTSLQDVENSGYPTNTNIESKSTNPNEYYYNTNTNTNSESKSSTNQNQYYYNTNTNNNVEKQGMSDTRYLENGKYYYNTNTNTNTNMNTNTEPKSSTNQNQYYNTNTNYNNNAEKQGMSDTRYMENGKYFYDVVNEKNMYYNPNSQLESTGTTTPQGYYNNYNNDEQFSEFNASENEQYVP